MSDDRKPVPAPAVALTRVPVRHIFWAGANMTHAGANMISNTKCYQDPPGASRHWTADYLPAWDQFELTFHAGVNVPPAIEYVPSWRVERWVKA